MRPLTPALSLKGRGGDAGTRSAECRLPFVRLPFAFPFPSLEPIAVSTSSDPSDRGILDTHKREQIVSLVGNGSSRRAARAAGRQEG
jgi:hypothetical protein